MNQNIKNYTSVWKTEKNYNYLESQYLLFSLYHFIFEINWKLSTVNKMSVLTLNFDWATNFFIKHSYSWCYVIRYLWYYLTAVSFNHQIWIFVVNINHIGSSFICILKFYLFYSVKDYLLQNEYFVFQLRDIRNKNESIIWFVETSFLDANIIFIIINQNTIFLN